MKNFDPNQQLLFVCLMADMDLWAEESMIWNFADDTQSIIIKDTFEQALETTKKEANNIISFFGCNNLVNNSDKAAVLYNNKGKGGNITVNIGGEILNSSYSEKLLGVQINSDFGWKTHIEKLCIDLKKRIGLLKRIKERIPKEKLMIIAEAIFNSKIRYGSSVYLNPVFDEEDLKMKKLSKNVSILQTLQNSMLRSIFGLKKKEHNNMQILREKLKMMSVNQMAVYHTLLEAFNVIRKSSSEQIKLKWSGKGETKYVLRSKTKNELAIPEKPIKACTGFSYNGSKLFNKLPCSIKEAVNINIFKSQIKTWIWKNIPAY